jgi:tetratricopeptide (TPR) repeat protein
MYGRVDTEKGYYNLMNLYKLDGFKDPRVYLDENHQRMAINIRNNLGRLASALVDEGQNEKAVEVLDKTMELLPPDRIPHNYFSLFLAEAYYRTGELEKGDEILEGLGGLNSQELDFFLSLPSSKRNVAMSEVRRNMAVYNEVIKVAQSFNRDELSDELEQTYNNSLRKMGFFEE